MHMERLPSEVKERIARHLHGANATAFATSSRMGHDALRPRRDIRHAVHQTLRRLVERRREVNGDHRGRHSLRTVRQLARAAGSQLIAAFQLWLITRNNVEDMQRRLTRSGFRFQLRPSEQLFWKRLSIHNYTAVLVMRFKRSSSSLHIEFKKHHPLPQGSREGEFYEYVGKYYKQLYDIPDRQEAYVERPIAIAQVVPTPTPWPRLPRLSPSEELKRVERRENVAIYSFTYEFVDRQQIMKGLEDAKFRHDAVGDQLHQANATFQSTLRGRA